MRLSVIAHNLRVAGGLSVGRNVVRSLLEVAPGHQYQVFVPAGVAFDLPARPNVEAVHVRSASLARRLAFEARGLSALLRDFRPDWVIALGNNPVKNPPGRQAVLLHDPHLVYPPEHYAAGTPRWKVGLLKNLLRRRLPGVDVLFCQTEVMRRRAVQLYGYTGRAELFPNAVSQFVAPPAAQAPGRPPEPLRGSEGRFKLFVLARYYPHKNLEQIVRTYDRFREELRDTLCVLTVDGAEQPRCAALLESIGRLGLGRQIVNAGLVPQAQLASYFGATDALLLPSLLESFSGSYLDAMHYAKPVLTSDLDFAREVCGDAALYFDPWHSAAMKDAVVRLRDDPELRRRLVDEGRRRKDLFYRSWPDTVRSALDVLEIPHD